MTNFNHFTKVKVLLDSGKELLVDVSFRIIKESDYGADADGNRGITFYEVESFDFNSEGMSEELEDEVMTKVDDALSDLDLSRFIDHYYN